MGVSVDMLHVYLRVPSGQQMISAMDGAFLSGSLYQQRLVTYTPDMYTAQHLSNPSHDTHFMLNAGGDGWSATIQAPAEDNDLSLGNDGVADHGYGTYLSVIAAFYPIQQNLLLANVVVPSGGHAEITGGPGGTFGGQFGQRWFVPADGLTVGPRPYELDGGDADIIYDIDGHETYPSTGLTGQWQLFGGTVELANLTIVEEFATVRFYYDEVDVAELGMAEPEIRLFWYDDTSADPNDWRWVLAGDAGNTTKNPSAAFHLGAPTDALGDWGVDTEADYAWANVDHSSAYGMAGPEPTTLALLLAGALVLMRRKERS